jgi:hypothetical protein
MLKGTKALEKGDCIYVGMYVKEDTNDFTVNMHDCSTVRRARPLLYVSVVNEVSVVSCS